MRISRPQFASLVHQARMDFESGDVPRDLLVKLYDEYCTDVDAVAFVQEALQIFPRGNCGLASIYLQYRLDGGEVTYGSYNKRAGHTIWHLGSTLMADITSDQFGGPAVYIGPIAPPWSLTPPR